MKVMILAAGQGTRMRPLTDNCPKPLVPLAGRPLIVHHLEKLADAGFTEVVINTAYLGEMLPEALGDGSRWGLSIQYSHEADLALETAGGIIHALPLLGEEPFLLVNGDVWLDMDYRQLREKLTEHEDALLWCVDNPEHNPRGDFAFEGNRLNTWGMPKLTYSGVGIFHPQSFAELAPGRRALGELLRQWVPANRVKGYKLTSDWVDVGTVERLQELERKLETEFSS